MHLNRALTAVKNEDDGRRQTEAAVSNFIRTSLLSNHAGDAEHLNQPLVGTPQHARVSNQSAKEGGLGDLRGFPRDIAAITSIVFGSWLNLLLVCAPLGIVSGVYHWGAVYTFSLNFLALIPLALILGDVTEDLALRFGPAIGGLINATFGNVVEIMLSIAALTMGLNDVVAYTLIGSILSNLLLVLGCCMLFGGFFYKTQSFNEVGNRACSSLLFLAVIGIIIPTAASNMIPELDDDQRDDMILSVSRAGAVILLLIYAAYLVFQLKTHTDLFEGDEEDEEEPRMSISASIVCLTVITVIVGFASMFITGSIEEVSSTTQLSKAFLGMIVLPIAGNACEHITAVIVAMKNKMDLALGVAVGSSLQISLLALPLNVVVAWALGIRFGLDLDPFSALALCFSVIHASIITSDGLAHWLQGAQLIAVYAIIGISYYYR